MRYYDANIMEIRDTSGNHAGNAENEDMDGITLIPCASPLSLTEDIKTQIRAKTSEKNIEKNN